MRTIASLLLGVTLCACGGGAAAPVASNRSTAVAPASGEDAAMPAEVDAFVERWELCIHWAGEEPYDAERRAEIERGVAESCPGNDETRAELERRYADRADVLARLRALPE